jgi:hypothetical protein
LKSEEFANFRYSCPKSFLSTSLEKLLVQKTTLHQKAAIATSAMNGRKVRIADLYAKRSEGPVSALHVKMYMLQHLLLSALVVGAGF